MPNWITSLQIEHFRDEILPSLLVALGVVLALAVIARLVTALMTRLAPHNGFLRTLAIKAKPPIHLFLPLMGLQAVLSAASDELLLIDGLRHFTSVAIVVTLTWLALRAVSAIEQFIVIRNPIDISDNLQARRIQTQAKVLTRTLSVIVIILGAAGILTTFPSVQQIGTSLLASAGLAGLVVGFAAQPVLGNLIAGLQIAITQPIRLDDVVIIENEWGRIEEITGTYIVVRIWDSRRLVVPLRWIIDNPFQNWTRHTASLIGSVFFWVDYSVPLEPLRRETERLCKEVPHLWDGEICVLQVTDCNESAMQIRVLGSSGDSSRSWDLRCYLRENLLAFINRHYPEALPRIRASVEENAPTAKQEDENSSAAGAQAERQPPV